MPASPQELLEVAQVTEESGLQGLGWEPQRGAVVMPIEMADSQGWTMMNLSGSWSVDELRTLVAAVVFSPIFL